MKKKLYLLMIIFAAFISSCKLNESGESTVEPSQNSGTATLTGTVVDHVTSRPIANAIIKIPSASTPTSTTSDASGAFSLQIKIQTAAKLSVVAEKDSYQPDTTSVTIAPGKITELPTLRLKQKSGDLPIISDKAASIYLLSQSADKLGIKESGDIETALATFQVIDSTGIPINISRAVDLSFKIIAGPNGGEFIYPIKMKTNELGQATTSITSGTVAGVVQIEATIVKGNITIRSKPIFFTIYGGFPVKERFAVAAPKLNYPYWGLMNQEIPFTALLGDKYSNPVRPNTAVYFKTTDGVIGDFIYTDKLGRATAKLATFGSPNHSIYGKGFFVVTAQTSTENATVISTETLRLLSYAPVIQNVTPSTFAIKNGGAVTISFVVRDFNNNPVSSDHTITISTQGGELTVSPSRFVVPDALYGGPGITNFSFSVGDGKIEEVKPANAAVTITISGPTGIYAYIISGTTE